MCRSEKLTHNSFDDDKNWDLIPIRWGEVIVVHIEYELSAYKKIDTSITLDIVSQNTGRRTFNLSLVFKIVLVKLQ